MEGNGVRPCHVGVSSHKDDICAVDWVLERSGRAAAGAGCDTVGRSLVFFCDKDLGAVQHTRADFVPAIDGVLCGERCAHARVHQRYGES